jgi:hypothetical protein
MKKVRDLGAKPAKTNDAQSINVAIKFIEDLE